MVGLFSNNLSLFIFAFRSSILIKIILGEQIGFNMSHCFIQSVSKLVKVLFVKVQFCFGKTTIVKTASLALGDGNVVIIVPCSFYIEKIRPLTCSHSTGKNLFLMIICLVVVFIHRHDLSVDLTNMQKILRQTTFV